MATKADKKNALRNEIIDAAVIYSQNLAGKTFLYVYGEEFFEVSFPVDHFLHLTGVETNISAKDFYKNAKKGKLTNNQFYFDARHPYANAKKKLPCLKRLPELTNDMVCILKDMQTVTIVYKLKGTDIVIENPLFDIKHNENVLKTSAPPATMSIGVQIQDPKTGYDILYHLVKKNTPLPASGEQTFKLSRDFNPNNGDCITIKIWEGENIANPEANHSAGEITIQSSAMDRIIPKGTEIDLTITEDEDRKIHVSGYIPDFEYEIPEATLRAEAKVDLAESMDKVDTRIKQSEVSLQRLKDQGVDVSDLEDELEQVKAAYDDTYDLVA